MIFDSKENLASYRGLSKNFAVAVDFLMNTDLEALQTGKIEIDGKEVYANVLEYVTVPWHEAKYESHEHYSDIQYMIAGSEAMTYAPKAELIPNGEYDPAKDVSFYTNDIRGIDFAATAGYYCIFLPQDGHKPKPMNGVPAPVKKIVVKVKMD